MEILATISTVEDKTLTQQIKAIYKTDKYTQRILKTLQDFFSSD